MRWAGQLAVVVLPEHIDASNAGRVREELLSVVNRGPAELIADMAATVSCDYAGADAVARAYQRAVIAGTELRLVVTARLVRRVLAIAGLDRLIPMYPSMQAAMAARAPAGECPLPSWARAGDEVPPDGRVPARSLGGAAGSAEGPGAAIAPAVAWKLLDALEDGVALADGEGVLVLISRRLEEMFGYGRGELPGHPVESLIPAGLHAAHRRHRAGYAKAPRSRAMGAGRGLVGLRKDGATFPVEVSLTPLPAADGHFTIAVIRDVTQTRRLDDLARAAAADGQGRRSQALLDWITDSVFQAGLSLQAAAGGPAGAASQAIAEALGHLDEVIRGIRDAAFTSQQRSSDDG